MKSGFLAAIATLATCALVATVVVPPVDAQTPRPPDKGKRPQPKPDICKEMENCPAWQKLKAQAQPRKACLFYHSSDRQTGILTLKQRRTMGAMLLFVPDTEPPSPVKVWHCVHERNKAEFDKDPIYNHIEYWCVLPTVPSKSALSEYMFDYEVGRRPWNDEVGPNNPALLPADNSCGWSLGQ